MRGVVGDKKDVGDCSVDEISDRQGYVEISVCLGVRDEGEEGDAQLGCYLKPQHRYRLR